MHLHSISGATDGSNLTMAYQRGMSVPPSVSVGLRTAE